MILNITDIGWIRINKYEIHDKEIVILSRGCYTVDNMDPFHVYYAATLDCASIIMNRIDLIW